MDLENMKPVYWVTIALLLLLLVVGVYAVRFGNGFSVSPTPQAPVVSEVEEPIETPENTVMLDNLSAGDEVSSPLTVTGSVPPGWMFEASFPVTLFDEDGEVITKSVAQPAEGEDWMSSEPVRFTVTLNFSTTSENGILRFERDNPSGLPENAESYDVAVSFR